MHTDPAAIRDVITTQLPSLLQSSSVATSELLDRHVFSCDVVTGRSASGKPTRSTFTFSLLLEVDADGSEITITTMTDELAPSPVPINGLITLNPEAHGTTKVSLYLTVYTTLEDDAPTSTRISAMKTMAMKTMGMKNVELPGQSPSKKQPRTRTRTHTPYSSALSHLLSLIPHLHTKFARYDEIDDATYTKFERDIPAAPPAQAHENALCDKSRAYDDQVRNGDTRMHEEGHKEHTLNTHMHTHAVQTAFLCCFFSPCLWPPSLVVHTLFVASPVCSRRLSFLLTP